MTDFVHPGYVISRNDGDRHWITGRALIRLYGLHPTKTVIVHPGGPDSQRPWGDGDRHFYPRADGNYKKVDPT